MVARRPSCPVARVSKGVSARDPYVRVNVNPSDRYVQSCSGSVESRLRPDGSGVDNLYLAGDWVRIGLNAGCIEQAVLGGRAAARAITGADMNRSYDNDRNWNDDGPISPALAALLSNLPDLTRLVLAGVGRVEACCIVDYVRPAVIEKMLPPGLSLKLPKAKPPERCRSALYSRSNDKSDRNLYLLAASATWNFPSYFMTFIIWRRCATMGSMRRGCSKDRSMARASRPIREGLAPDPAARRHRHYGQSRQPQEQDRPPTDPMPSAMSGKCAGKRSPSVGGIAASGRSGALRVHV